MQSNIVDQVKTLYGAYRSFAGALSTDNRRELNVIGFRLENACKPDIEKKDSSPLESSVKRLVGKILSRKNFNQSMENPSHVLNSDERLQNIYEAMKTVYGRLLQVTQNEEEISSPTVKATRENLANLLAA